MSALQGESGHHVIFHPGAGPDSGRIPMTNRPLHLPPDPPAASSEGDSGSFPDEFEAAFEW